MKWKTDKVFFLILLGILFISHLPFITADPDRNMSVGRGPFTDEGLNTIQVRNWVNNGGLSLTECDNLLKTPMLGFPLALTYNIFGTSHVVSRLHVLLLVFLGLLWIGLDRKTSRMMIIFLLSTALLYPVFQSSHFSMGEMLSVASVLLAIHFLARSFDPEFSQRSHDKHAVLSGVFLSLSYFIKIQFIYLIALLPVVLFIHWFNGNYFVRKMVPRQGFAITSTLLFFLLLYLLAWYIPNKEAYDYMMVHQSGEFVLSKKMWEYIHFNLDYHFIKGWIQWFCYFFLILLVAGFFILNKTPSKRYPVLFFSSLAWFFLELHKLTMAYLPTRYQVSLFVSMGLLISVVSHELLTVSFKRGRMLVRTAAVAIISIIVFINIYNYTDTLQHRTYSISETNEYLARSLGPDDIVLGAWAPSLTWSSKSRALPVWNNFLNYEDPVNTFKPGVIIAEIDEQDSEQAWSGQGINLREIADSSRTVRIGQWDLVIYWIGE
jgi:hypothetical protein